MDSSCEFSEDELVPPSWINKQLFESILKNVKGFENQKLANFIIQPASKKGDHYASIMFRATIECTQETKMPVGELAAGKKSQLLQVIIKTRPPLDTPKGRNLSETQIFENEWKMYTQVIPLLESEWQRYGVNVQFAGRLLYATLHPQPVIVLEDLCLNGYDILRGGLFNLSEVEACLRKLAKWHAVSYKLTTVYSGNNNSSSSSIKGRNNIDGAHQVSFDAGAATDTTTTSSHSSNETMHNTLTQMQLGLFKQNNLLRTAYMSGGVGSMIKALETYASEGAVEVNASTVVAPKCGSFNDNAGGLGFLLKHTYLRKLRLVEPHIMDACVAMNDAFRNGIRGPIYVLNHGDFHTTNIMIRRNQAYNRAQLDENDIIFIDFQMSFFGPSTFDLQYASVTLLSRDLRDNKKEYLMKYYFEQFLECLRILDCKTNLPTFEQFQADCKRWRFYELYLLGVNLPLTRFNMEKPHKVDINQIFDSDSYRERFYKNPDYLNYLIQLLPKLMEEDYLE